MNKTIEFVKELIKETLKEAREKYNKDIKLKICHSGGWKDCETWKLKRAQNFYTMDREKGLAYSVSFSSIITDELLCRINVTDSSFDDLSEAEIWIG